MKRNILTLAALKLSVCTAKAGKFAEAPIGLEDDVKTVSIKLD